MRITRRGFCLSVGIGTAAACGFAATRCKLSRYATVSKTSHALGTQVEITVLHASRRRATLAIDAAFTELDHVEEVLSLYRPTSQLCQLNREGVIYKPHPYLVTVLTAAQKLAARSQGKFDVTIQPLWELYANKARAAEEPSSVEIAQACDRVNWRQLEVSSGAVQFRTPQMAATLNGIAQGFAADQVVATLRKQGIEHALINTGELTSLGSRSDGKPWQVGVQHPREADAFSAIAQLDGRCLATSGDYATKLGSNGERHHLFDPATGESPNDFASVSILAPSGLLADGLSTAVFVLGVNAGVKLVEEIPGADLFAILPNGRTLRTAGFPLIEEAGA